MCMYTHSLTLLDYSYDSTLCARILSLKVLATKAEGTRLVGSGAFRAQNMGGWAFDVVGIFDVVKFQQGFSYIVPGTEYQALNLVLS